MDEFTTKEGDTAASTVALLENNLKEVILFLRKRDVTKNILQVFVWTIIVLFQLLLTHLFCLLLGHLQLRFLALFVNLF